jgi:hypothetical protein
MNDPAPSSSTPDRVGAQTEDDIRLDGVKGWLLLFVVSLTVLVPLFSIFSLVAVEPYTPSDFAATPFLRPLAIAAALCRTLFIAFSVYTGWGLWSRRLGAVQMAKLFLLCYLGYAIVDAALPILVNQRLDLEGPLMQIGAVFILRASVYVALWYTYLTKSRRVQATYGPRLIP